MTKITFLIEGHKACQWDEVKEAVVKHAGPFKEGGVARPLIYLVLSLIEFVILSKAKKAKKETK